MLPLLPPPPPPPPPRRVLCFLMALHYRYIGHEPAEVNFWCPVVDVYDSNTLQTESEPGKRDFRPMVLSVCRNHQSYGLASFVNQLIPG